MAQAANSEVVAGILANRELLAARARKLTGNKTDAEDLVQDTIVKAMTGAHTFIPGTNIQSWLVTVMRNLFLTQRRRKNYEILDEGGKIAEARLFCPPAQDGPLDMQDLMRILGTLPDAFRQIVEVVEFDGNSYEQSASIIGVPLGTIKSRSSRAREAIRVAFGVSDEYKSVPKPYKKPKPANYKPNPERDAAIYARRLSGESWGTLAKDYGISRRRAYQLFEREKHGGAKLAARGGWTDEIRQEYAERDARILIRFQSGEKSKSIAAEYGITTMRVYQIVQKMTQARFDHSRHILAPIDPATAVANSAES